MDKSHFETVRQQYLSGVGSSGTAGLFAASIGTLGEKALHAIVKSYIEPDPSRQEIKIGSFHVDCFDGTHIHEIQTRHFHKLNAKLDTLLPQYPVTVVYPMPARKWLLWIDPQTGLVSNPRLSPKRGNPPDVFRELYRIKAHLTHPNFSLLILLIDLEEYRLLNGWSADRKKGSHRSDRLPLALDHELWLHSPADFAQLLPAGLPDPFTSMDYAKAARTSRSTAQTALNILRSLEVISCCGKKGRALTYCCASSPCKIPVQAETETVV